MRPLYHAPVPELTVYDVVDGQAFFDSLATRFYERVAADHLVNDPT